MKKQLLNFQIPILLIIMAFVSNSCASIQVSNPGAEEEYLLIDEERFSQETRMPETEIMIEETLEPIFIDSVYSPNSIPNDLTGLITEQGIVISTSKDDSLLLVPSNLVPDDMAVIKHIEWVYVLAAPFPTIADTIGHDELIELWRSEPEPEADFQTLLIDSITFQIFRNQWGNPGDRVVEVNQEDLISASWRGEKTLSIVPFEAISPRWKVIKLDELSPFGPEFKMSNYLLVVDYVLVSPDGGENYEISKNLLSGIEALPEKNYDPELVTSVMLTGVTALVRETAARMERNGIEYPALDLKPLLLSVDILHISNEVSFYSECPSADPPRTGGRFCSNPAYVSLLLEIGADVVELTGNHLMDYGKEALLETLDIYDENGLQYFGGGRNLEEAIEPLIVESNGTKFAFLGCNVPGPAVALATEQGPGAAPCDFEYLENQIAELSQQGYQVIVTFQHYESCQLQPMSGQRVDFDRIAEAGAIIVSGSQAHCPQGMRFINDSFVHYGLGNLFFDQMFPYYRSEFLDEHVFYQGKYIGVVLHTAILEDYAKPRLMTKEERQLFLEEVFGASSW